MSRVAEECQKQKHHPEWSNTYNVVFVRWTTHKTGGLTEKDVVMARFCDGVATEVGEIEGPKKEAGEGSKEREPGLKGLADAAAEDGCGPCGRGGVKS
jgi:4a-hydroxytetrahydrobiopterin dehydratase